MSAVRPVPRRRDVAPRTNGDVREAGSVIVGKDVLELLTGAMYVDPMTIFREYIQNAADAIDLAKGVQLYRGSHRPRIDIRLDPAGRSIKIRDNGGGISAEDFWARMTSIGASAKRGTSQRGFRGVGRLSGLGYAAELIFRTRAPGESHVSTISWSGRKLREILREAHYSGGLDSVVRDVAETALEPAAGCGAHFFEVELRGVLRIGNDILLNPDEVRAYLAQTAPVPFADDFAHASSIHVFLETYGISAGLDIYIDDDGDPVRRPLATRIRTHGRNSDSLREIEFIQVPSVDGSSIDAVGWIAHHSYLGAIPRSAGYGGIRIRAGNIQVGSANLVDSLFPESRFNAWCVAELHVLSARISPNGRRDDFELNAHYQNLRSHTAALALRISKTCRDRSIQRNRVKRAAYLKQLAEEQLLVLRDKKSPVIIKQHYRRLVEKTIGQLKRVAEDKRYSVEEQKAIGRIAESLAQKLADSRSRGSSDPAVDFIPAKVRRTFLDTLKMAIAACDSPEQAAQLTRRIMEKARRRYAR